MTIAAASVCLCAVEVRPESGRACVCVCVVKVNRRTIAFDEKGRRRWRKRTHLVVVSGALSRRPADRPSVRRTPPHRLYTLLLHRRRNHTPPCSIHTLTPRQPPVARHTVHTTQYRYDRGTGNTSDATARVTCVTNNQCGQPFRRKSERIGKKTNHKKRDLL